MAEVFSALPPERRSAAKDETPPASWGSLRSMKRRIAGAVLGLFAAGCTVRTAEAEPLPAPEADLPAREGPQTAVFAAGCFWCVEAVFERVSDVVSGYAGGSEANADYQKVSMGLTEHAEAVKVTYDPDIVSYGTLLHVLFSTHDPTTKNRQGPDVGPQYRSAIFYDSESQKRIARAYIAQLEAAEVFDDAIVTTLEPLEAFHPAEPYHQDFVKKHPRQSYVRAWAIPKLEKLEKLFPDRLD